MVRCPTGEILFSKVSTPALEPTQPPAQRGPGVLCRGQEIGSAADTSSPFLLLLLLLLHHQHPHHLTNMLLGHLLTRSGLTRLEASLNL